MDSFLKKAAAQINQESEKLASQADAKIGHGAGDQVKKFGAEAADKIQHINTQNAQAGAESEISKLKKEGGVPETTIPNVTTGNKAAVPESANPTTGLFASTSSQRRLRALQRWLRRVEPMSAVQMGTMGTVSKIPGNTPDIPTTNPVADNSGGSAPPQEAKPNA